MAYFNLSPKSRTVLFNIVQAVTNNMAANNGLNVGYVTDKVDLNISTYNDSTLNHMLDQIHWLDRANRSGVLAMIDALPPSDWKEELQQAASEIKR